MDSFYKKKFDSVIEELKFSSYINECPANALNNYYEIHNANFVFNKMHGKPYYLLFKHDIMQYGYENGDWCTSDRVRDAREHREKICDEGLCWCKNEHYLPIDYEQIERYFERTINLGRII